MDAGVQARFEQGNVVGDLAMGIFDFSKEKLFFLLTVLWLIKLESERSSIVSIQKMTGSYSGAALGELVGVASASSTDTTSWTC